MAVRRALLALGIAAAAIPASSALAWTKSYVVEWIEPALYYGGPESGSAIAPGTDCPNGITPQTDWKTELQAYNLRSPERAAELTSPEYPRQLFKTHWGFRGPNKDNIYENPTVVPDKGIVEVTGKLAEGFDLDGNPNNGFTGLDGTPGVDNAFYKVSGCILGFRAPARHGARIQFNNEGMHNGAWASVVVMSGDKDPMNDDDVTIGLYNTSDRMVKDAGGNIANDYTFRIDPNPAFESVFKAKVTNGVVETKAPVFFRTHDNTLSTNKYNQLKIYQTRLRWKMNPDGSMDGLVAGYRDWFEVYMEKAGGDVTYGNVTEAGTREDLGHYNLSAWYYSLRRNADGLKDPKSGQNRGISMTYRMTMLPAFVVSPNADKPVTVAQIYSAKAE